MRRSLLAAAALLNAAVATAQPAENTEPESPAPPLAPEAPAPAQAPEPPAAPVGDAAVDAALTEVIESRCRQGVDALARAAEASRDDIERSVARRVLFLCNRIVEGRTDSGSTPSTSAGKASASAAFGGEPDRSGRGKLAIGATLYGLWVGIAVDLLAEIDEERVFVIPPLLGLGAGLGGALWATREGQITSGQAWTVITGLDYGSYTGALFSGMLELELKPAVGVTLAAGLVGGGVGTAAAFTLEPTAGDAELLRSGGLWGFTTGGLIALMVQPDEASSVFGMLLAGMDGGLVAGAVLAHNLHVSRNRMLLIDAGALAGGALGAGGTLLVLGNPEDRSQGRAMAGITLAGLYAGMFTAAYLTADMEGEDAAREQAMALVHRPNSGGWELGRPLLLPSFSPSAAGPTPTGAWMPLIGGYW